MTKNDDLAVLDENPQTILGVTADATPEEIRAAYLNKIREYPPYKFPAEFERVRDAYAILSDARNREPFSNRLRRLPGAGTGHIGRAAV